MCLHFTPRRRGLAASSVIKSFPRLPFCLTMIFYEIIILSEGGDFLRFIAIALLLLLLTTLKLNDALSYSDGTLICLNSSSITIQFSTDIESEA